MHGVVFVCIRHACFGSRNRGKHVPFSDGSEGVNLDMLGSSLIVGMRYGSPSCKAVDLSVIPWEALLLPR